MHYFPNEYFNYTIQAAIVHISLLGYKELKKNPSLVSNFPQTAQWKEMVGIIFFPNLHVIVNLRQILISLDSTPKP